MSTETITVQNENETDSRKITEAQIEQLVRDESPDNSVIPVSATPSISNTERSERCVAEVDKIAVLIVGGLSMKGARNFEVGDATNAFCRWYRSTVSNFQPNHYTTELNAIAERTRAYVSIDLKSIRIVDWCNAAELRRLVRDEVGELADKLTYDEYQYLTRKNKETKKLRALFFDKATVTGIIRDGWIDFIKTVTELRCTDPKAYTGDDFSDGVASHEVMLANLAASYDPEAAKLAIAIAERDKAAKVRENLRKRVGSALVDVVSGAAMTSDEMLSEVLGVAKAFKLPAPKGVGCIAASASDEELEAFVVEMMRFKRWDQIRGLHEKLGRVIAIRATVDSGAKEAVAALKMVKSA